MGFSQYSCCVCGMHHEHFAKNWEENRPKFDRTDEGWKSTMRKTIDDTLRDLGYYEKTSKEIEIMKNRIDDLVYKPDNYIINKEFLDLLNSARVKDIRILTDGPRCLVRSVFPVLPEDFIITGKSGLSSECLRNISDLHVGTSPGDLRVPQTRFIISSRYFNPSGVQVHRRLTKEVMSDIISY